MHTNYGLSRGLRIGMAVVALLAIAQLAIVEYGHRRSASAREHALGAARSELALERAMRNLSDAETAHLQYLLTGREALYQRYSEARDAVLSSFDAGRSAGPADPSIADGMRALKARIDARLKALDDTTALFRAGRDAEVRQRILGDAASDEGKVLRAELARLATLHQSLASDTAAEWRGAREISRTILVVLVVLVLAMFLWLARAARDETRRIVDAKRKVEDDKERLETMVRARTQELSELTTWLHKTREDERRALARTLHDELGAIFTAAKLDATFIRTRLAKANSGNADLIARCDRMAAMIDQGTAFKRRTVESLRPSTLDMLGLAPAARDLVETFAANARVVVDADIDDDVAVRSEDAVALYRLLQEALANIEQHAEASEAWIELKREGDMVHLRVRDNGRGFDPHATGGKGHGIAMMRQRIRALGGRFDLASEAGGGTTADAWLPYRED
jgi:signal transduction histidine kinase